MTEPRTGVYPGTFDPITNGHVDIIRRGAKLVDRLVIGIAVNIGKDPVFSLEERVELVDHELAKINGGVPCEIVSQPFENLLMHFVEAEGASMVIRGLRAVSDFDYEFQMAGMNYRLTSNVETVFLMASETNQFISSRFVKDIAQLGGKIESFVPANVAKALNARFQ